MLLQSALRLIYPAHCIVCGALTEAGGGLCGSCWVELPFIAGASCDGCGAPLPGDAPGDEAALCDDCLTIRRPWRRGGAVATYDGTARRLVLALKHGDRQDLADTMAGWMVGRLREAPAPGDAIVPVPIHWRRMLRRRFNQAAVLADKIARRTGAAYCPDALVRTRPTPAQERMTVAERFRTQAGAIAPHPSRGAILTARRVVLVDDVMTSGATLAAATHAARQAGARNIDIVTFARVVMGV